jgi:hypothetical protein
MSTTKLDISKALRDLRRKMLDLPDVNPGKSGMVRDLWCRHELRQSVAQAGLDPDDFKSSELKKIVKKGELRLADGQAPRRVTLRMVFNRTVQVARRKDWRGGSRSASSTRVYESQSNHHVEIRRNAGGQWTGKTVRTFDAALRARREGLPPVDRSDHADGVFVLSLAAGETVRMVHPETKKPGYFVVFKLDGDKIHFMPHWDARPSRGDERHRAHEDISLSPRQLQELKVGDNEPFKVWVGPLGDVRRLERD